MNIFLAGSGQLRNHLEAAALHPRRQHELGRTHELRKPRAEHDLQTIPLQYSISLNAFVTLKKLKLIYKRKVEIDLLGYHAKANRGQQLRTI